MIKHESKFGLQFRAWWRFSRMKGVFELKDTRGKPTLSFSEVDEEQIDSGIANKSKRGNLVRVQSGTPGTGDYIGLVEEPSYIVIKYPGSFEIIDVEVFSKEKKRSKIRSLTLNRAKKLSVLSVKI